MHMTFWLGYDLDGFYFSSINLSSVSGLVWSCVVLFVIAICYECLKVGLGAIKLKMAVLRSRRPAACLPPDTTTMLISGAPPSTKKKRCAWFVLETLVYTLEVIFGYILMLGVMYYNGYMLIAVVIGVALVYAFVGPLFVSFRIKSASLKSPCTHCSTVDNNSRASTSTIQGESSVAPQEMQCCNGGEINDSPTTSSTTISHIQT